MREKASGKGGGITASLQGLARGVRVRGLRASTRAMSKRAAGSGAGPESEEGGGGAKKTKKEPEARAKIPQSDVVPRASSQLSTGIKAVAWNVAGLRGFLAKDEKRAQLAELWRTEAPDVLALSEHKLQTSHVEKVEADLRSLLPGLSSCHWACSLDKKGYSGTVVLLREGMKGAGKQKTVAEMFGGKQKTVAKGAEKGPKRQVPLSVSSGIGGAFGEDEVKADASYNREGRVITVEYEHLYIVHAYVPNSGQGLKRLDYRIDTWEKDMNAYIGMLDAKKAVLYMGDLNCAHLDLDIWNVDAKHIPKQSGCTPQERKAFDGLLTVGRDGMKDAFRWFNPDASGWFSFWSTISGNYGVNRGLRLDYAIVSARCFTSSDPVQVREAFYLTQFVSDHCPVGIAICTP